MSPNSRMKRKHSEISDVSASVLHSLEGGLNDIRELITCRICVHPMFEPYTTECGHTFCYSCLSKWFEQNHAKKSCPDCRAKVKSQPAPVYVVRDIAQLLANRHELLGAGENLAEHAKMQQEEKQKVEQDRTSSEGLFQGVFSRGPSMRHIHDAEDGVTRCPNCTWELEDGQCVSCGYQPASSDESEVISDDSMSTRSSETVGYVPGMGMMDRLDLDALEQEEAAAFFGQAYRGHEWEHAYDDPEPFTDEPFTDQESMFDDEVEDDDDDDESAGSLDGFVVDDEAPLTQANLFRFNDIPNSDSEEDQALGMPPFSSDEDSGNVRETLHSLRAQYDSSPSNEPGDQSDSEPIVYHRGPRPGRNERAPVPQVRITHRSRPADAQPLVISSGSESDEPIVSHSRPRARARRQNAPEHYHEQESGNRPSSIGHPTRNSTAPVQHTARAPSVHSGDYGPRRHTRDRPLVGAIASSSNRSVNRPQPDETSDNQHGAAEDRGSRAHHNRRKRQTRPQSMTENGRPRVAVVV